MPTFLKHRERLHTENKRRYPATLIFNGRSVACVADYAGTVKQMGPGPYEQQLEAPSSFTLLKDELEDLEITLRSTVTAGDLDFEVYAIILHQNEPTASLRVNLKQ